MRKKLQKTLRHAWSASLILLSLSFLPFSAQSQCDYKIVGYDSYGDGWNGASIDVDVAGVVTNFTLSSGSIDSTSIASYNGDITTFTFNSGSFDSEITFDIYAPDGTLLGSYGPSPSTGLFLTDTSNSVCSAPSCLAPSGLALNNLGIDSASISWNAAGSAPANGYDYQLVPDGNGLGVGVVASGNTSSTSQAITGLNGNTTYDFYVRSNCGSNDTSSYAGPLSFTTLPDSAQGVACTGSNSSSVVFSEDFDNNNAGWTGDVNSGLSSWEIPDGATSSNTGADNAYSGSNYMNYEASSTSANSGSITSPAIDLSVAADDAELSFWMHAYGASMGTLEIGVGTSSSGPFTTEFTWTGPLQTSGSDAWVNVGVDLSSYLGQTIYIQLTQHDTLNNLGSGFDGDMSIDLFEVSTCISCAIPSNNNSSNVTATSADLDWTENGSATSWEISYGSSGFTPGNGTQTVVSSKPYTLTGLSPQNTTYDWYVRAICGAGDTSAYSPVNTFTTLCNPFTAPYTESFDANAVPNCWSRYEASGSGWEFGQQGSAAYAASSASETTGNGGYYAWIDHSGGDDSVSLEGPEVDVTALSTPGLIFDFYSNNTDNSTTNYLYVEAWNGTAWAVVDSFKENNADWVTKYVDLTGFTFGSNLVKVRFRSEEGGGSSDFYNDLLIDEVKIQELPTCFMPGSLQAYGIGTNDATLSWATGGASNWQIQYDVTGFTPGTGNFVAASNDTFTITGLSAQTTYDAYVRDSCGPGDVSAWTGPVTFTTACLSAGLPYSEDFTAGFPTCWTRSNSSDVIIDSACGTNNSNYLRVDGVGGVNATTPLLDASSAPAVQATWSYRAACNNAPESGDAINVDYWNGSSWVTIKTYDGSTAPTTWTADTATVPGGNSDFQIRFDMQSGSGSGFDDYDFDSLSVDVSCTVTAPITESFDANAVPTCWSRYDASGSGWEFGQQGSAAYAASNASERTGNGGYYAWIDHSGGDDSASLETYEIDVSALTTPGLAFDFYSNNTDNSTTNYLYVEAWNGTAWAVVDSFKENNNDWVTKLLDLSGFTYGSNLLKLRFRSEEGGGSSDFYNDLLIDEVKIEEFPTCPFPAGVASSNLTDSSALISWTSSNAVSAEVEYGPTGFSQGNGTIVTSSVDSVTLSGLNANTAYDYYVRVICGPNDTSSWTGASNFTTLCAAFTAPYSQNFDGTTDPNIDACWSTLNTTSSSSARVETENSSFDPQRSAPNAIEFYNSSGSGGELLLISPQLSDLDSTKQVAFYAQDEGSSFYTSGLVVGTMSDPTDAATFHPYDSIPNSMLDDTWQRFVITFDTLTGNDQYIAIGHDQDDSFDYIFLDDLEYTTIPSCPKPTNLAVGQITANDAQVTFTQGGNATDFNIAYGSTGFSLGSGTQVSVTNDTATLSGLSPQTSYDVYVRDSCAAGDVSQWVGPVSFTTACLPLGLPYSEDFTAGFPTCWTRSNSSDVIIDSACGTNNSNYLRVDGVGGVNATTPLLDASGAASVQATWSYRAACNNAPETGDAINVDYWNGSSWVTIKTYDGSTAPTTWTPDTATVPGGNSDFQIRFDMQSGSGNGFDDYDFDSLSVDVNCVPYTAPITESFDANAVPTCWSSYETSGGGWEYGQNGSAAYAAANASETTGNGGYYAWIDFSGTDDSTNLETYEVDVSALTTPSVSFDLFSYNTDDNSTNILYVEAWNGSNWVQADSLRGDLGGWQRQYVDLSSYTYGSNLVKVRFRGESGGSSTDYYNDLLIDEVSFDELPSCLASTGLRQLSATDTSATITWDAGGSAINYLVEYGSPGFTPGTGTVITATNDTVTITGLTAATNYDFYVTDSCGAADLSTQSGPGMFSTEACQASAQCSYLLNLYDTWGDGWNGNEVDVFQGGFSTGSFGSSFTSGDSLTGLSLALCPNQTIDLILNEGSFSSEIEFFVINPAGDTVASHLSTSGLSTGDTLASFTTAPAANAGMSGSDTVCTSTGTVDLTSYLGTYDQGGTWTDLSGSGALTDSLFNASAVGSGTYNFTYQVSSSSGCSVDSAGVTITVDNLNNAGADSSITACSNAGPVTLNNVVSATGGSWVDLDNSGAFNATTSDFTPMASMGGSTFRFGYILSGGTCPDDTAIVSVTVDVPANAGGMVADTLCDTAMVVDLNNYLDTAADAGGSWVDVNGTGALSGSDFDPSMVTPSATYDFRYVVNAPCGADSTTVSLYVDFCSSSVEEYLNGQVNLFPNPAQNVVNIETTGTLTNMDVTVYDAQGKALIRSSVPTNGTKQLDVSALPAGMYTVSIQSDQGMAVKRFVKE